MTTAWCPATSASPTTRPVNSEPTIERCRRESPRGSFPSRVEQREPCGRSRAAWRAIDLAVREHRHVSLGERLGLLGLPEDHAVDVPELRLEWVDDVVGRLELCLDPATELDQARELTRLHPLLERRVERPAERDVDDATGRLEVPRPDERRDIAEADRLDTPALDPRPRLEPPGRDVHDDARLPFAPLDDTGLERPRHERDRPVAARRRVPLVVEEDDPEVGAVVVRRDDVAAVHVRVPARLEDEEPADVVEALSRVAPPLEDRRALERRDAGGDDAERLAAGVVVDRLDPHRVSRRRSSGTAA